MLKQLPFYDKAFFRMPDGVFHAVMRHAGSAHPVCKEPLHRAMALDFHRWCHHSFNLALQITGRKRAIGVLCLQGAKEPHKAGVRIFCAGLAEHFAQHVEDPGTLAVDDLLESFRAARGIESRAELQASNLRWRKFRCIFFDEPFAEAVQPDAELVVRNFLAVRKKKREVGRKCLVDPLIAIVRPSDNISPPLMSDFMKGNEVVKVFLTRRR